MDPDDWPEPEPMTLSDRLIGHYQRQLEIHTDDPSIGMCKICRQPCCEDYRAAWQRLYAVGLVSADAP